MMEMEIGFKAAVDSISKSGTILSAVLAYAEMGWPGLPIHAPMGSGCSCFIKGCKSIGKHPAVKGGWKAATIDPDKLHKWFDNSLKRNLAIATGSVSGIFVLDVDGALGEESLAKLEAKYGPLPKTASVLTGRGRHLYFLCPPQGLRCSAGKIGPGLDIRGDGGYIIVPPSLHQNGKQYEWS